MKSIIYTLACLLDSAASLLFDASGKPTELPAGPFISKSAAEEIYRLSNQLPLKPAND